MKILYNKTNLSVIIKMWRLNENKNKSWILLEECGFG
jgi:hypothetical protein